MEGLIAAVDVDTFNQHLKNICAKNFYDSY
jgi:hypothetical protein